MSMHTEGRITFKPDGDANHYSMLDESGRWWLALIMNGEQATERQQANLQRLAACWNACDGYDTEALEALGKAVLDDSIMERLAQRVELLVAARQAEAIFANQKWREDGPDPEAVALKALRSAIAAARGDAETVSRMAACWNACAGLSDAELSQGIVPLHRYSSLANERDEAWAESREIRAAIGANPEEATVDEVRRVVTERDAMLALLRECRKWQAEGEFGDPLPREFWTTAYTAFMDRLDAELAKASAR